MSNKIERWIDLTSLPIYKNTACRGKINWKDSKGCVLPFIYGDISGEVIILECVDNIRLRIYIEGYTDKNGYVIGHDNLKKASFRNIFFKPTAYYFPKILECLVDKSDGYKYSKASDHKIMTICPRCGKTKEISMFNLCRYFVRNGEYYCSACSDGVSYPNKFIRSILKQLDIKYIPEYSPDWIGGKLYDCYFEINNNKYIVEMDGGIGHGRYIMNKSITAEESKLIDECKDNMAFQYGIEVIRINCDYKSIEDRHMFIKNNILNSKLNKILDLSNIDWSECERFSISSLLIKACEYWESGIYSSKKIANLIQVSNHTAVCYLNIGTNIGLCNYDKKIVKKLAGQKLRKPINVYKNDEFVGKFDSISQCVEMSYDMFGTKFTIDGVSAVCNHRRKTYRGYVFVFTNEDNNTKLLETEVAQWLTYTPISLNSKTSSIPTLI